MELKEDQEFEQHERCGACGLVIHQLVAKESVHNVVECLGVPRTSDIVHVWHCGTRGH
jgi:hypothetical protein